MTAKRSAQALVLVSLVACTRLAAAGPASFESTQFHPSDTANGYLSVDGAFPVRHLGFTVGLFGTYGHEVLVLRDPTGRVPASGHVISNQFGMDLVASFGVFDRLELGIDLPFVAAQSTDNTLAMIPGGIRSAGVGDLRMDLKVRIYTLQLGGEQRIGLTLIAGLRVPSGDSSSFLGQDGVSGFPRLVAEWRHPRASVALNLGAVLRSTRTYNDLAVTHQVAYGAAAQVHLTHGLSVLGELWGLVGVGLPDSSGGLSASEAPAELAVGLRYRARFGLEASLAGGAGLSRGYGTPDGRLIFGLRFQSPDRPRPNLRDRDRDGVPDAADECPDLPGRADNGGCPDVDSDGDSIVDRLDKCPHASGLAANGGCPDVDSDGDGLVDRLDRCPNDKGDAAHQGCPQADHDGDGVPDAIDRCPAQAGSRDNDGCPDIDSDGDGVVDRLDKCPFDAETFNGNSDEDGCPDAGAPLASFDGDRIFVYEKLAFDSLGAVDKRSMKLLSVIATLLKLHPEIGRLRIEGHTDNRGSAIDNLDLSRARAAAVRRLLIDPLGVDGKRLVAQGFGPDRPVADNKDSAGRAKNNRIDFVVVEKKE
jgi:outer membrane protein OmpA-like peptidoglycan-associated protein